MTAPIDFGFRLVAYWDPADPESAVVGNIKGQLRREMVRAFIRGKAVPELGELEDQYLDDEVDDQLRRSLGSHHPHFLGGEYLPSYLPGEVEIAPGGAFLVPEARAEACHREAEGIQDPAQASDVVVGHPGHLMAGGAARISGGIETTIVI